MEYFFNRPIFWHCFCVFYSKLCFIIRENQLTLQTIYAYQYDIN